MSIILIVALAFLPFTTPLVHPVNHQMVQVIKDSATTWIPMEPENNPFYYMPVEQIKAMLGTKLANYEDNAEDLKIDIPTYFDARYEWQGKIHPIRDQGFCSSGYALSATDALSDRLSISGKDDVLLSTQQLVSCDTKNFGCKGGYLKQAWDFMHSTGVVSDSCYPYTSKITGVEGECYTQCQDDSSWVPHHSSKTITTESVLKTQQAIFSEGPVEAAFSIYEDFFNYEKGVYEHITGSLVGAHAVKVIGWGTLDNKTDYWIMANTWGTRWGMDGYFMIKRGDCGVDDQMTFASSID